MKQNPEPPAVSVDDETPVRAEGDPVSRGEWITLALLVTAGLILRSSGRLVEHFDEGVYASNLFFGEATDFRFPNQHLYAPPLLPASIEWCMVLLGPSNFAAKLPAIVLGVLTIPLTWWTARGWFGRRAGLLAAAFVAGSVTHIGFSSSALTDVPVAFWMLAAVVAMVRGFESGRLGPVILGGVLTGIAWWTKYSGWLPLAIMGAATVAYSVWPGVAFHGKRLRWLASRFGLWVLAAATASVVWSPWWWALQKKGGYAAVAANHRGYLVGWSGWLESAAKQIGFFGDREIAAILAICALIGIHLFSVLRARSKSQRAPHSFDVDRPTGPVSSRNWAGRRLKNDGLFADRQIFQILMSVVAVVLKPLFSANHRSRLGSDSQLNSGDDRFEEERSIGPLSAHGWFGPIALAVWIISLSITIPLYRPYYRLTVPLLIPLCLVVGSLASRAIENCRLRRQFAVWCVAIAMFAGLGIRALGDARAVSRLAAVNNFLTHGLRVPLLPIGEACRTIGDDVLADAHLGTTASPSNVAVYVYGEPAILFHLRLLGFENAVPVSHLGFARPGVPPSGLPTFVVVGPHAEQSTSFPTQFAESKARLHPASMVQIREGWIARFDSDTGDVPRITVYRVD